MRFDFDRIAAATQAVYGEVAVGAGRAPATGRFARQVEAEA
jgi:hypothetical protein